MMPKGHRKPRNKPCVCKFCEAEFLAADFKASVCPHCKTLKHLCACGCEGIIVGIMTRYIHGHHLSDSKNMAVKIGHKKQAKTISGDANPSKRPDVRKKLSIAVKQSYRKNPELRKLRSKHSRKYMTQYGLVNHPQKKFPNNRGMTFRSRLEARFSDLLFTNGIMHRYEVYFRLCNGAGKLVDFMTGDALIEISGFAYDSWQKQFISSMDLLRRSTDKQIIVLTYPDKLEDIYAVCNQDIYTCSIFDDRRILETLQFCTIMEKAKNALHCIERNQMAYGP